LLGIRPRDAAALLPANLFRCWRDQTWTAEPGGVEAKTTDQLVAATVASLRGQSIEQYANGPFRHWKIGRKDNNNGVLLVVAPYERTVRIEVGYGLEGVLTDSLSKTIIEQSICAASGRTIWRNVRGRRRVRQLVKSSRRRRGRARSAGPAITSRD
jgi:hypothetical protein